VCVYVKRKKEKESELRVGGLTKRKRDSKQHFLRIKSLLMDVFIYLQSNLQSPSLSLSQCDRERG